MKPIYLDHNATTMMEQSAQNALLLQSTSSDSIPRFGNPSSIHWAGRKAKSILDEARETIAASLGVQDPEVLCFTSSATESINTALKGFFFHEREQGKVVRFLSSAVEHEATLDVLRFLETLGAKVELLPVDAQGELSLSMLEQCLLAAPAGEAVMVSLLAANNETGVIFPWKEAAQLAKKYGATFHLDGVQAWGKIPGFTLAGTSVPLASFSAHKIGGPKGVGVLVAEKGSKLVSLLHGGSQERKRRAGTVNVPGIAAFAAAAKALGARDLQAMEVLRMRLEKAVLAKIPGAHLQGEKAPRLVNTSNFLFDGVRGEALLMALDLEGFAVSSGSACHSGSIQPSHVLLAMGFDKIAAGSAVRVSLGPHTTLEEIDLFVAAIERVVSRIRGSEAARLALRQ